MAQSILDHPPFAVYPENHRCENCLHWLGDYHNKIYARIAGKPLWVGQCIAIEEHDDAPCADLDNGAEAFVFTPLNGRCRRFETHPDVLAEEAADAEMDAYYHQLDNDLRHQAWIASGRV